MFTSKYGCIVSSEERTSGAISGFISMIRDGNLDDPESHRMAGPYVAVRQKLCCHQDGLLVYWQAI